MKVLVADDNRDAVSALTSLLETEGHEVQGVCRSADVLAAEGAFRPDAVILDLQMPDISGYDLARWLRSRHPRRCPLLIALTGAFTRPADRSLSRAMGFDHYLVKPAAVKELLALLARSPSR
ncbi:MAG TPA: response regulator [Burkholderiales bacterium]|nr:response regulator [Burkholderiales bacterium]